MKYRCWRLLSRIADRELRSFFYKAVAQVLQFWTYATKKITVHDTICGRSRWRFCLIYAKETKDIRPSPGAIFKN
jgi:hypothetical protein